MNVQSVTFNDLFEEIKFEIFKYLNLNERIRCRYVCREWYSILFRLLNLQETLVIGQPEFDSADRSKLSLCNINPRHIVSPFNTVDACELIKNNTEDGDKVFSDLLKSLKNLKSVFVYTPVKMKLSDLPDTVEHIHFGHCIADAINFDKTSFGKLTCISTIDAHLDSVYMDGITNLLKAQKLQLQNVSVCEVPRSLCEQIIEMRNLKQLYVFDFNSDFDELYKERKLEVMDAHPQLQYFNMFTLFAPGPEMVCPTDNIKWLVEFGSITKPLDKKFVIDVFDVTPFTDTLEFAKDYVHGLHLTFLHDFITITRYETKLTSLRDLRLSCRGWFFTADTLRLSLEHILLLAPNVRNFHLRLHTLGIFGNDEYMSIILKPISAFAIKNSKRMILFELSSFGEAPTVHSLLPMSVKNLNVVLKSMSIE